MKIKCSKKQKYTNDNICLKLNNWVDFRFCSFNLILLDFFFCFFFYFPFALFCFKFFTYLSQGYVHQQGKWILKRCLINQYLSWIGLLYYCKVWRESYFGENNARHI